VKAVKVKDTPALYGYTKIFPISTAHTGLDYFWVWRSHPVLTSFTSLTLSPSLWSSDLIR
jgi:hypothetical protein